MIKGILFDLDGVIVNSEVYDQQIIESFVTKGVYSVRGKFTERLQHKGPLMNQRMRNHKLRIGSDQIIVKQKIQVQCPRSPVDFSLSACFLFQ